MNRREFLTLGAACAVAGGCTTGKAAKEGRPCAAFDAAVDKIDATTLFDEEARKAALSEIQKEIRAMGRKEPYFEFVRGGLKLSDAEVAAAHEAYPPLKWYDHAFDKVLREFKDAKVEGDSPAVWYVYNMGVVVKTAQCAFSIDLCHRKAALFAPLLDFALISHNHEDHYTREFVSAMGRNKNPVRSNFLLTWDHYCRELESEKTYKNVRVVCTAADHNQHLPKAITCFECHIPKTDGGEFVIFHSGDCCRADHLKPSVKSPDLYFGHCAIGLNFKTAWQTTMPAKLMLPVHHQELGHLGGPWRCVAFNEEPRHIINALRPLGANVAMPVWGDRIV